MRRNLRPVLLPFFRRAEHRMGMPALSEPRRWTVEMLETLPDDGNRYECIDGELFVTPSPVTSHQSIVAALLRILAPYAEAMGIGPTFTAPLDIRFSGDTLVQPDLFVIRRPSGPEAPHLRIADLVLFIEILSPTTVRRDRFIKRDLYLRAGVQEYWIVDAESREVERWRPGVSAAVREQGTMVWHPEGASRPLMLDLPAFFAALPALPEQLRVETREDHV
jgi:Uma2 family endonuclease